MDSEGAHNQWVTSGSNYCKQFSDMFDGVKKQCLMMSKKIENDAKWHTENSEVLAYKMPDLESQEIANEPKKSEIR